MNIYIYKYIYIFIPGRVGGKGKLGCYYNCNTLRRTKDEGRRTKDEGRRTKDEGRRTKDEGRRTKDEGRRTKAASREKIYFYREASEAFPLFYIL